MDTFTTLIIFYTNRAIDIPFPPSKDSNIRQYVNKLRQERQITPNVLFIKEGTPEQQYFNMFLLEEQTATSPSHQQFVEQIATRVQKVFYSHSKP